MATRKRAASIITDTTSTSATTNRTKKRYRPKVSKTGLQDPRYASRLLCQLALIDPAVLRNCPEDLIRIATDSLKLPKFQPVALTPKATRSSANSVSTSTVDNTSQSQNVKPSRKISQALIYLATDYREAINAWDDFASDDAIADRARVYSREVEETLELDDEKDSDPNSLVFKRLQNYLRISRRYEEACKAKGSKDLTRKDFVKELVSGNEAQNGQSKEVAGSSGSGIRSDAMLRALVYGDKFRQLSNCLVVRDNGNGNIIYDLRNFLIYIAWIWNDVRCFVIGELMQIVKDYDGKFLDSKKLLASRTERFNQLMDFTSEDNAIKLAKSVKNDDATAAMLLAQMSSQMDMVHTFQRQEQQILDLERLNAAQSTFGGYPPTGISWQEGHQNFNGCQGISNATTGWNSRDLQQVHNDGFVTDRVQELTYDSCEPVSTSLELEDWSLNPKTVWSWNPQSEFGAGTMQ